MDNQRIQITKQGLAALQAELTLLVSVKRPKAVSRLEYAREQGDITENSDYSNAKDELEFLDGRIDELEHVIDNAQVVSISNGNREVAFGTRVTVKIDSSEHVFEIVGEWEADPLKQKISHESPLGKALLGKKVGELVEVEAPVGKITYKIVNIS